MTDFEKLTGRISRWMHGKGLELDPETVHSLIADNYTEWVMAYRAGQHPEIHSEEHLINTIAKVLQCDILDAIDSAKEGKPYEPTEGEVLEVSLAIDSATDWGEEPITAAQLGVHFVGSPPVKYRYMNKRLEEITSDQERYIMRMLQEWNYTVEQVRDELQKINGKRPSKQYVNKVRDKHTHSLSRRDLYKYWDPYELKPTKSKKAGWPISPVDPTKDFEVI